MWLHFLGFFDLRLGFDEERRFSAWGWVSKSWTGVETEVVHESELNDGKF